MAFSPGNAATFSIGGTDISPFTTSVNISLERDVTDINPIGGAAISKLVGPYGGTISLEGAYDPTIDGTLSAMFLAATPALQAVVYRPSGTGGRSISCNVYVSSFEVDTPGDDTATWTCELAIVGTVTDA